MYTLMPTAIDLIARRGRRIVSHACYVDVEPGERGYLLVLRGRDRAVGRSRRSPNDVLILSDDRGIPLPISIMMGDDRVEMERAGMEIIEFYSAAPSAPFSERINKLGACASAALSMAILVFGARTRMGSDCKPRNGWGLGSFHDMEAGVSNRRAATFSRARMLLKLS